MKKIVFILLAFIVFKLNAQDYEADLEFEVPQSFFNEMFRGPSDQYLVAWSGAVKIVIKNKSGEEIQITGAIESLEDFLNSELTSLARRQFKYNLKTPKKRVSTPDKTTWAGHCGYDPYKNISFNDVKNGKPAGWPSAITSEPWALHLSKKTSKTGSYTNPTSGEKEFVSVFFHASSVYYYHKIKPQSLKGRIDRDDNYAACGQIGMYRLGPGYSRFKKFADVEDSKFEFTDQLFLGDYQVQYLWPDGTFQVLEEHVVYDPFGNPKELEYELETFEGEISGTLVDEETKDPIKNQKLKLVPVCTSPYRGLPEKETTSDGEGEFTFTEVPTGVYNIITKGAPETQAGLTKSPNLRVGEIEVKQNVKYDIIATYTAPGFAKAKLLWANNTIKFPEKGTHIQKLDIMSYKNSGGEGAPLGTDGEPLTAPYSMLIPGIGLQTIYGYPENEYSTPEVIFVASLGGYKVFERFKVNLAEDALNSCSIYQENNGPICLELGFDLTGKYPDEGGWQQVDVGCEQDKVWNITKGNSLNGYPLLFKQVKFTDAEIEKFKNGEAFEIFLSGLKATMKIEFKPLENE